MPQKTTHHGHDGPHKDRWHYMDYRDGKHDSHFCEWKYFNFVQDDLAGYIFYYTYDPEGATSIGGGRIVLRLFKDGIPQGKIRKIDMNTVQLDSVSASATFDKAEIIEKNEHDYLIVSKFPDMSWDLNYRQEVPSVESYLDYNHGLVSWERWSWRIKMPRAEVTGRIQLGNDSYNIRARGYTDTNWGELLPIFSHYEWAQFSDKNFALLFGIFYGMGKPNTIWTYVELNKHLISFENSECTTEHLSWVRDKWNGMKIPGRSVFTVRKDGDTLTFKTRLLASDTPGIKISALLPKTIISEQLVHFEGQLEKDGALLHKFSGTGFQEWSSETWRKIAVPF